MTFCSWGSLLRFPLARFWHLALQIILFRHSRLPLKQRPTTEPPLTLALPIPLAALYTTSNARDFILISTSVIASQDKRDPPSAGRRHSHTSTPPPSLITRSYAGCFVIGEAARNQPSATTPPSTETKKRKASTTSSTAASQPQRKSSKASHHTPQEAGLQDAALPATPLTLASDKPMDSDDDFGSVVSSDDIDVDGDSSVDFGAAGECGNPPASS